MSAEFPPTRAKELVDKISRILKNRDETIAVSEAACGGLLSSYLVSIPGASQWFHGGTLVYSLKSRLKLSGWSQKDIDNYTGPSVDVALRLARNLRLESVSYTHLDVYKRQHQMSIGSKLANLATFGLPTTNM